LTSFSSSVPKENTREPALRFSLAGIHLKFSAIMETSGGFTIPAEGMSGSWIVNPLSTRFPSVPENEYAMMALALAAGIEVPRTDLVDTSGIRGLPADAGTMEGKALAVQRFDCGQMGQTIHMEDFAQVFGLYPPGQISSPQLCQHRLCTVGRDRRSRRL